MHRFQFWTHFKHPRAVLAATVAAAAVLMLTHFDLVTDAYAFKFAVGMATLYGSSSVLALRYGAKNVAIWIFVLAFAILVGALADIHGDVVTVSGTETALAAAVGFTGTFLMACITADTQKE